VGLERERHDQSADDPVRVAEAHYETREAKDGTWFYVLVAANGEVLSTSETYTRREDAERGIADAEKTAEQVEDDS
jgi:uncharacterized protein YegP (UPF0339 family)